MLPKQGTLYLYHLNHPESKKCLQCLIIMFLEEPELLSCLDQIEKDLSVELDLFGIASDACMKKVHQWLQIRLLVILKTTQKAIETAEYPPSDYSKNERDLKDEQVNELVKELHRLDLQLAQSIFEEIQIHLK